MFTGRFLPAERCDNLNTWPPLKLDDGIDCIIVKDGIIAYSFGDSADSDKLREHVKEILYRLLDGYALISREYLVVSWDNWIEIEGVASKSNPPGLSDKLPKRTPGPLGHPDSLSFYTASRLLPYMETYPRLRLALRDWRIALGENEEDYASYCCRALESIRLHFQASDSETDSNLAWAKMHVILGTSPRDFAQVREYARSFIHYGPGPKILGPKNEYMALLSDTMYKFLSFLGISTDPFPEDIMLQLRDASRSRPELSPGEVYVVVMKKIWDAHLKKT